MRINERLLYMDWSECLTTNHEVEGSISGSFTILNVERSVTGST